MTADRYDCLISKSLSLWVNQILQLTWGKAVCMSLLIEVRCPVIYRAPHQFKHWQYNVTTKMNSCSYNFQSSTAARSEQIYNLATLLMAGEVKTLGPPTLNKSSLSRATIVMLNLDSTGYSPGTRYYMISIIWLTKLTLCLGDLC